MFNGAGGYFLLSFSTVPGGLSLFSLAFSDGTELTWPGPTGVRVC